MKAWVEPVTFDNPLQNRPFTQTIYLARTVILSHEGATRRPFQFVDGPQASVRRGSIVAEHRSARAMRHWPCCPVIVW